MMARRLGRLPPPTTMCGQLVELREAGLRFSAQETAELPTAVGPELPEVAVVALGKRTEGWAAGPGKDALSLRTFLLETSVLERLSGGLCDAVTGRSDSQRLLEQAERANLFLHPLDEVRGWRCGRWPRCPQPGRRQGAGDHP